MRKELRPGHDAVSCEVCGRTMLKGERAEAYLAPGGQRKLVCDLCTARADHEGWIRESAHGDMPATRRPRDHRRPLMSRLRRRRPENGGEPGEPSFADEPGSDAAQHDHDHDHDTAARSAAPSRPKDPRHVRAVPTNAQVKIERALEVFNGSEHPRTIAGIARTLGHPWVAAIPRADAPSEVELVVAWELSWYRYRIDLGDESEPITLLDKGQEIDELDDAQREWNASASEDGRLAAGVVSGDR